jgi:hypothetical protein
MMLDDIRAIFEQMLGTKEIPEAVINLYTKVKFAYDRVGGGALSPQTMALIAILGGEMNDPNQKLEEPKKSDEQTIPSVPPIPKTKK